MKNFILTACAVFAFITFANAQTIPSYIPTSGLVGWWPFNGNANDESGNGLNGIVNGATLTTDRFGIPNRAFSFDGINDDITANRVFQSTFSFSGWYLLNTIQPYIPIVDANDSHWELLLENLKPTYVQWIAPPSSYNMLNTMTINSTLQWYHIACTFAGSQVKIYLNGNLLQTFSGFPLPNTLGGTYYFGSSPSGSLQNLDGKLDDIGIWNRALSNCEIKQLYMSTLNTFTFNTVTSTSVVCSGQTTTLTASGASSYTWQPMSVVNSTNSVTPLTTSLYTVVATNTAGCTSTKTISILVNPTPTITVNSGTICTGQSFTITPTGASTYTYSSGSSVVSPTLTTTYSVTGTNTLGCNSTSPALANVFVSLCTGIDELDNNTSIVFYPNPFINEIYFNSESDIVNKKYFIYNTSGQVIESGILNGTKINCSDFSKGLYFIKLEGSTKLVKVIKEN